MAQSFEEMQATQRRIDERNKRNEAAFARALNVPVVGDEVLAYIPDKGQHHNAVGFARLHALTMIRVQHAIATDEDAPAAVRVAAAEHVLDRALGRPTQPISGDDERAPIRVEGALTASQEAMLRDMLAHPERYAAALGLGAPEDGQPAPDDSASEVR